MLVLVLVLCWCWVNYDKSPAGWTVHPPQAHIHSHTYHRRRVRKLQIQKYTNTQIHKYANTQILKYTNTVCPPIQTPGEKIATEKHPDKNSRKRQDLLVSFCPKLQKGLKSCCGHRVQNYICGVSSCTIVQVY